MSVYGSGGWQCAECGRTTGYMPKDPDSSGCKCAFCGHKGTNEEFLAENGKVFGRRQKRFMKRAGIVLSLLIISSLYFLLR